MKEQVFTILNSQTIFDYETYVEDCELNERTPEPDGSSEFYNWCYEMAHLYYEDDLDNIKYSERYNVPCVITGSCGLWNGRHEIMPIRCETLYDAIMRCVTDSIIDVKATFNNGIIDIDCYHHDGTNCFTIECLSKLGQERLFNCYDGYIENENIPNCYTKKFIYE